MPQTLDQPAALVTGTEVPDRPATYREVFANHEYRVLFASNLLSLVGDQVAAVAVAVLLYQRSGSALLAAFGYATAYLPWFIGGPVLSAWAERLPARRVLVGCDLARVALIGCAALPGLPLAVVGLLVLAAAMLAPPFDASVLSVLLETLEGDCYDVGMSVRTMVHQGAQLAGFAGGGALVVLLGAQGSLALDAATFAGSALLLRRGISLRPAALARAGQGRLLHDAAQGFRMVRSDPRLRQPLVLGIVGSAYVIVPEAIATAYAASLGYGPAAVGLVMAAVAGGSVLGAFAIGRLVRPSVRHRAMRPLALIGTLPLLLVALRPGLGLSLVLFTLAGAASAFQVPASVAFAQAAPTQARTRAFAVAMAGMYGGQTFAIIVAGAMATVFSPASVVAGAAAIGAAALLGCARRPAATFYGSVPSGLSAE